MDDKIEQGFDIVKFLRKIVAIGASDVHLKSNERPAIRINGKILKVDMPLLAEQNLVDACKSILPTHLLEKLDYVFDLDFAYEIEGCSRFRVNLNRQFGKIALVIRAIPYEIKSISQLMLPDTIEQFATLNNGLVLITGPTGSGKSTTIASLVDYINKNYAKHIITIEDPVEFIFKDKKSIISQRQLLIDTMDFPNGIKYALRQDPDVIFIGEIRDRETIAAALKAAETGHLVFATIHTNGAIQTVNRIINMFDPSDRDFIRSQLAQVLRGTVSQNLIPKVDNKSRIPACEVLVVTPTVKDYIIKDNLEEIYELVKKGTFDNMITMNLSLFRLCEAELITQETAMLYSDNKVELQQMFKGVYHGTFGSSGR